MRSGRPDDALSALLDAVRESPGDAPLRVFLAQLSMVQGNWQRALSQLQAAASLDQANVNLAQAYRLAIAAEGVRQRVFSGELRPPMLGEPEQWMAVLLDLISRLGGADDKVVNGEDFEQALAGVPQVPGRINGEAFEWCGDADMRLGPFFELILNGRYFWVPGHRIRRLVLDEPRDLRDLVWMPVAIEWTNGGAAQGMMPTRYPGADGAEPKLRLARSSEFTEAVPGVWVGAGQRMFATDGGEYSLLDIRELEFGESG